MIHHAAQNALVRMLYDPAFAEVVRREPERSGLAPEVARMLRAIDPRALAADPLRRRRTLGALVEEFKAASTIALAETRSLGFLESFFGAPEFHASVEERTPLALAFGRFLAGACAAGRLRTPQLLDVARLETLQARARREAAPVRRAEAGAGPGPGPSPWEVRVRLAPGVLFARFAADVLDAVQRVERYLFELQLLPQLALCDDGPRLAMPPRGADPGTLALLVVPTENGISLVPCDDELVAVLEPLAAEHPLARGVLVEEAARALGASRAEALVAELLEDEVLAAVA